MQVYSLAHVKNNCDRTDEYQESCLMMVRLQPNCDTGKSADLSTSKMVSTRGVKFKFSEGEKVLCYEPDPTKAKVLYESKVLKLVVSRDSGGRKIPEYLIHFFGWNSSWDRCVAEDFILPDNEENRILQKKLSEDAALSLKGKRRRKLPAIIKETLGKKLCSENYQDIEEISLPAKEVQDSFSETESSEEEELDKFLIDVEIPLVLKERLEDDCHWITKKNMVVKIPCEPNVVSILQAFVKHVAVNLLCGSPQKGSRHQNNIVVIPEDAENKIQLCREVMDGLRIYFDFTLPHLLLYKQEQEQYFSISTMCKPIGGMKRDGLKDSKSGEDHQEDNVSKNTTSSENQNSTSVHTKKLSPRRNVSPGSPPRLPSSPTRSKGAQRQNQNQSKQNSTETVIANGGITPASPKPKASSQGDKPLPAKRVLRSSSKSESAYLSLFSCTSPDHHDSEDSIPGRPESPLHSISPTRPTRTYSKLNPVLNVTTSTSTVPTTTVTVDSRSSTNNTNSLEHTNHSDLSRRVNPPPPLNISNICNSLSSSASSTHSSLSSPKLDRPSHHSINTPAMLSEILSWNMLPSNVYEQTPSPPSLIYGVQHLLRLFVKLPELIHRMNMPRKKLGPLVDYIKSFLQYLAERQEELFLPSVYVQSCEIFKERDGNS